MSSKFAHLDGVDFDTPDVYETESIPSPTRKSRARSGARGTRGYDSSNDEYDDSEEDDEAATGQGAGGASGSRHRRTLKTQNEGENDDAIDRAHLNADEAARRFRDATGVDGKGVDFSTSIHRRRKLHLYPRTPAMFETKTYTLGTGSGYRAADDDNEAGTEEEADRDRDPWHRVSKEPELPVDRFRRLRFEIEEMEKELTAATDDGSHAQVKDDTPSNADLLPQLLALREQMAKLEDNGAIKDAKQDQSTVHWRQEARRLLESLHKAEAKETETKKSDGEASHGAAGDSSAKSVELARVSELDKRLASLESLIGVHDALQDEGKSVPRPMVPALARIEHLLILLTQPRHLDGINRKIKGLVLDLERVHETRRKLAATNAADADGVRDGASNREAGGAAPADASSSLPPDVVKRLDGVLPSLSKIETLLPIVPTLLTRLHSLSTLHASSSSFAHDVESLEGIVRSSSTQNEDLQQMLRNLETSIKVNEERTKENLTVVEERMESILKRIDALSSTSSSHR